jgi:hypothetical protein
MTTGPSTYRAVDEAEVSSADASVAWVLEARPVLERTARTYRATITYKELSEEVQQASGIRTRRLLQHWIGNVLSTIAANCHDSGEPLLSALCVRSDGTVGPKYGVAVVENFGGDVPDDLDMHAAEERFQCYRHFGAEMPEDGGSPALTKSVAAARARAKKRAVTPLTDESRPICPTCFLMLPVTGQCDNCS